MQVIAKPGCLLLAGPDSSPAHPVISIAEPASLKKAPGLLPHRLRIAVAETEQLEACSWLRREGSSRQLRSKQMIRTSPLANF